MSYAFFDTHVLNSKSVKSQVFCFVLCMEFETAENIDVAPMTRRTILWQIRVCWDPHMVLCYSVYTDLSVVSQFVPVVIVLYMNCSWFLTI